MKNLGGFLLPCMALVLLLGVTSPEVSFAKNKQSGSKYTQALKKEEPEKVRLIDWYLYKTDNLNFYMTEGGKKYAYVYYDAEKIVEQEIKYFNVDMDGDKIDIFLFGNEGFLAPIREAAYNGDQDLMVMNGDGISPPHRLQDIRYHFAHEMAHAMTNHKWGMDKLNYANMKYAGAGTWLIEGIAEYTAKQQIQYTKMKDVPPLKDLGYGKATYTKELKKLIERNHIDMGYVNQTGDLINLGEYFFYESVVYFMIETKGKDNFFSFLESMTPSKRALDIDEAIKKYYGKSNKDFIKDWKKYYGL
ncbi:hypothetical protein ACTID9_22670 [Brevibacillus fluminis]|uniref:hypothetical protein n=1 Tax=Brevibacillus fluminis TaxID=511487 RepID=UPI003F89F8A7